LSKPPVEPPPAQSAPDPTPADRTSADTSDLPTAELLPPAFASRHGDGREALYALDGPIDPEFVSEVTRALIRTLPLETGEPQSWCNRRIAAALNAVAAMYPRDEIELMLCMQAVAAHHAAAAAWRLGMNHASPRGDSTRHITAAATAGRAFDTLLRAVERRQAKPLAIPPGRPPNRTWDPFDTNAFVADMAVRIHAGASYDALPDVLSDGASPGDRIWTREDRARVEELRRQEDYPGLNVENVPGILPGGGMIIPEFPSPDQKAYLAYRYANNIRGNYNRTLLEGGTALPKIVPMKPGDWMP
jgi:hypothetical protein